MVPSSPLSSPKDTDIHAGIDVKKKTTRVNLVIVVGVILFFALGALFIFKTASNPPQSSTDTNPLKP